MKFITLQGSTVDDRWTRYVPDGTERIADFVRPFAVALVHSRDGQIGSGVLVRDADEYWILTAGHVVKDLRDDLALGTIGVATTGGMMQLAVTSVRFRFEPSHDGYIDAGVLGISAVDARKVPALTTNRWFSPGALREAEEKPLDELGRLFVVGGYPLALTVPNGFAVGSRQHNLCTFTSLSFHRVQQQRGDGAFEFCYPALGTGRYRDPESAPGPCTLMERPELPGMSGAPVFTFDVAADECVVSLVGTHAGHNGERGIICRVKQHRELLMQLSDPSNAERPTSSAKDVAPAPLVAPDGTR